MYSLPGPQLSGDTAVTALLKHRVNVGLGVMADYDARNARFEIAWVRCVELLQMNQDTDIDISIHAGGAGLQWNDRLSTRHGARFRES